MVFKLFLPRDDKIQKKCVMFNSVIDLHLLYRFDKPRANIRFYNENEYFNFSL